MFFSCFFFFSIDFFCKFQCCFVLRCSKGFYRDYAVYMVLFVIRMGFMIGFCKSLGCRDGELLGKSVL